MFHWNILSNNRYFYSNMPKVLLDFSSYSCQRCTILKANIHPNAPGSKNTRGSAKELDKLKIRIPYSRAAHNYSPARSARNSHLAPVWCSLVLVQSITPLGSVTLKPRASYMKPAGIGERGSERARENLTQKANPAKCGGRRSLITLFFLPPA